jgi:hypothetical protein
MQSDEPMFGMVSIYHTRRARIFYLIKNFTQNNATFRKSVNKRSTKIKWRSLNKWYFFIRDNQFCYNLILNGGGVHSNFTIKRKFAKVILKKTKINLLPVTFRYVTSSKKQLKSKKKLLRLCILWFSFFSGS